MPSAVARSLATVGEHLSAWRRLNQLTVAEVADRAGVGESTVLRLERGQGATLENVLRVARALGVMDVLVTSLDPFESDVGRLRADQALPQRVRRRAAR